MAASQRAVSVNDLVEAYSADALAVDEDPVVGSDAGSAGAGGVAGEAEGRASLADG